ncbi:MAG TPA: hypothetical protein VK395_12700 [Gemmataceae bacterium]|nr:hypothetical protein [Gemmataceae bacterium]
MAFTINAFNHSEWQRLGLLDYGDFADMISECNVGEDAFSGYGEWWYVPDDPQPKGDRVIYFGSWGNDNSPGASMYTNAEIFDMNDSSDVAEYAKRVREWESQPEYLKTED